MDSDILRRLIWAGLLSVTGALATVAAHRLSGAIWRRVFNEEPPASIKPRQPAQTPRSGALPDSTATIDMPKMEKASSSGEPR